MPRHPLVLLALLWVPACRDPPRRPRPAPRPPRLAIPATCFERGSRDGEGRDHERPRRRVCLSAFRADRAKVTNRAWDACVAAGQCQAARFRNLKGYDHPDLPVVGISWTEADAYCRRQGGQLPTEAEWELLACGPNGRTYPWGDDPPTCALAHFKGCPPEHLLLPGTWPRNRSPLGAEEPVGNAWEWVADAYAADAYATAPDRDPRGPATGEKRVIRGGSYADPADHLRCRSRFFWKPDARLSDVGFRCVVPAG